MNPILNCLSNRARPFTTSTPDPVAFAPSHLSADVLQLRQKLCLDLPVDYYLRNYLANLYSWPDLWQNLMGRQRESFDPLQLPRPGVQAEGCELLASETGVAVFEEFNLTQRMPVPFDWSLRWHSPTTGIVRDELSGRQETTRVWPSVEVLRVTWPVWSPFSGPLRIRMPWAAGCRFDFHVEPAMFPWVLAAERIQADHALDDMLVNASLVDEYGAATSPRLKVALATALLVLNHPTYRA